MHNMRQELLRAVDQETMSRETLLSDRVVNGDHYLNGVDPAVGDLRSAAVLVPIIARPTGPTLLLTVRAAHLPKHAGQIAFPGGKIEAQDVSPVAAAIRETYEEVGIADRHIEVLGCIDVYQTVTDFRVLPVVAWLDDAFSTSADRNEVADIFEVPLDFVLDRRNHRIETTVYKGQTRRYFVIDYQDRAIWGATAGMIRNLSDRLEGTPQGDAVPQKAIS